MESWGNYGKTLVNSDADASVTDYDTFLCPSLRAYVLLNDFLNCLVIAMDSEGYVLAVVALMVEGNYAVIAGHATFTISL